MLFFILCGEWKSHSVLKCENASKKNEKITVEGDEIVPDVKPDVLSIVSANGNICMYKKEIQDGKIKLDGSINSYVIYIADDENSSMRALNTSIDFSRT